MEVVVDPEARPVVLVNAIHAKAGGGKVYLDEIAPRLARLSATIDYRIVVRKAQAAGLAACGCRVEVVRAPSRAIGAFLWDQTALVSLALRRRAALVYTLGNVGPIALGKRSLVLVGNSMDAGADATSLSMRAFWAVLSLLTRCSLAAGSGGLAVSGAIRDELVRRYGTRPELLEVVYHGVSGDFRAEPRDDDAGNAPSAKYVLAVGDVYPHKNLIRVIDAFEQARSAVDGLVLVLAGREIDGDYARAVRHRAAALEAAGRVVFLGWVPRVRLAALYRRAEATLCLSTFETFGIPLIEAMACGSVVVASDRPFAREVAGDAAIFVSPDDVPAMTSAIRSALSDGVRRRDLRERGLARARSFDWDLTAARVHAAITRRVSLARGGAAHA